MNNYPFFVTPIGWNPNTPRFEYARGFTLAAAHRAMCERYPDAKIEAAVYDEEIGDYVPRKVTIA